MAVKKSYVAINQDDITSGPYLSTAILFTASRASETTKDVTITCDAYFGFGGTSDIRYSTISNGVIAWFWTGNSNYDSAQYKNHKTVVASGVKWERTSSTWGRITTADAWLTQKGYPDYKSATGFSVTVKNWTSGSKTVYFQTSGPDTNAVLSATLPCPDYYTAPTAKMDTESQTIDPDSTIRIEWTGTGGTNNPIDYYNFFINGNRQFSTEDDYYDMPAPAANTSVTVKVSAIGANYSYGWSGEITITVRDYGTPTVSISTRDQELKPDSSLLVEWVGTPGLANPIEKYELYYNQIKVYEGTDVSYELEAPPVDSRYNVNVRAVGKNGNKVGQADIYLQTKPYVWVVVNGLWKSVQSIYIFTDNEWKNVDASEPMGIKVQTDWKGV